MIQTVTQFAAESAEKSEGIAALGIDPIKILLQTGTFLILFYLVRKYALSHIVKTLADRRATIEESLENAHDIERQRRDVEAKSEKILADARAKAHATVEASQKEAQTIVTDAEVAATKRSDSIVANAEAQADQKQKEVRAQLKSEMVDLVANATGTILEEKVDAKKDKALIDKALKGSK